MKKKPYDVYSPEIYPRLLFVSTNIEDLDKYFIFLDVYGNNDGSEYNKLLQEIDKYDGGMVTCKVIRKSDNKYGVIVIAVTSIEDITPDMIPHEAVQLQITFVNNQVYIRKTLKTAMKRMPIQQDGLQEI